jgi:Protein of unknown function (DUF1622)
VKPSGRCWTAIGSSGILSAVQILLGLEFLIAGDIVRTVAATPTFQSVGILVVIVLVRTFLSLSLELEVTGRLPWDRTDRPRKLNWIKSVVAAT